MRPPADHEPARLSDLSDAECRDLLASHRIGRLAWNDADEGPVVLPVSYAFDDEQIWVRTSAHTELARHFTPGRVAFEVDRFDEETSTGWSVLARGTARIADPDEVPSPGAGPTPVVGGTRGVHVRITVDRLTGRRVLPD